MNSEEYLSIESELIKKGLTIEIALAGIGYMLSLGGKRKVVEGYKGVLQEIKMEMLDPAARVGGKKDGGKAKPPSGPPTLPPAPPSSPSPPVSSPITPPGKVHLHCTVHPQGAGTISPHGDSYHSPGAGVNISTHAHSGWVFHHWNIDGVDQPSIPGRQSAIGVIMYQAHSVVAVFGKEGSTKPSLAERLKQDKRTYKTR